MLLNLPSKIILDILLPEVESFIHNSFKFFLFSVSPVTFHENKFPDNYLSYKISLFQKEIFIDIFFDAFPDDLYSSFSLWFQNQTEKIRMILCLLCKSRICVNIVAEKFAPLEIDEPKKRIDISFSAGEDNYILSFVIPDAFFKMLLQKKEMEGQRDASARRSGQVCAGDRI